MEVTWPSPYGYTIFCDDVREEVLGKLTLVGVYRGEMTVILVPGQSMNIPKLHALTYYFERPDERHEPLELRVYLPGDAEDAPSQRTEIPPRDEPPPGAFSDAEGADDPRIQLMFGFQFAPLVVRESGYLKVRLQRGDKVYRLGAMGIRLITAEEAVNQGIIQPNRETR